MRAMPSSIERVRAATTAARAGLPRRGWPRWPRWAETFGVLLSPALATFVLRLRLMAPIDLPDPAMHTVYMVDPQSVFNRYTAAYAATARLRESGSVGMLVPGRLAYLAFGAVPGYFVLRYVFALLAIIPVYLLLRRLYGPPAGVVGILAVLSSPVIITAWGTDYPNAAIVSYVAAAIACLAMPCSARWRRGWLSAAGVLLVLAVWSHPVAVPLVGATLAGYVAVRLLRARAELVTDMALLAAIAVTVTAALVIASGVLLGHANFIAPTWDGYRYLSQPGQAGTWHSSNWRWAPYVAYLLVPPALLGCLAVAVARSGRSVSTPVLLVGVMATAQLATFALLQFAGSVQDLEMYYFSSTLWAGACLVLAITVAELARPLAGRPVARWLPAAVLLAIPLGYEADPHVPSFGWLPIGVILVAAMLIAVLVARAGGRLASPLAMAAVSAVAVAALAGAALVLTVAPNPPHKLLSGEYKDPTPAYAAALGGSSAVLIDNYRIAAQLPAFAGTGYPDEQLFIWWPVTVPGIPYQQYSGMFHGLFNSLDNDPPALNAWDRVDLAHRRPAEIMLLDTSAALFPQDVRSLAPYRPVLLKSGTFRSGPLVLYVWLLRLGVFYHPPRHG